MGLEHKQQGQHPTPHQRYVYTDKTNYKVLLYKGLQSQGIHRKLSTPQNTSTLRQ